MKKRSAGDPPRKFGRALKKFRIAAGLSQEGLAVLAGVHRNYAGAVERGEMNVSLINMARLAKALRIPLSKLVQEMERS